MFTGSMVAIATPMREDGAVDYDALAGLVDFHLQNETDVIIPAGTTGESATLNHEEHCEVIRFVVEEVKGRVPVVGGTGANSTWEAVSLTRCAADAGVDACLLVTPYYNKPTQEGLYQHYKKVAEEVDVPQILYNVPSRTACDMLPETVLRLSAIDNIIGIKEATGDMQRARQLIAECPEGFAIYSGDDATARELMLMGGNGDISVTANVAPKLMSQMCAAALAGDATKAAELDSKLAALHRDLFVEANPIPVKWAVAELGLISNSLRLPMTPLSAAHHQLVRSAMRSAELV